MCLCKTVDKDQLRAQKKSSEKNHLSRGTNCPQSSEGLTALEIERINCAHEKEIF
jgi:hypothetical protein